jgi:hypothetical protein
MANKYQRKVNASVKRFNKSFQKDIAPYNEYRLQQVKQVGRNVWESLWVLELAKNGVSLGQKWLNYHDIIGLGGRQVVGRELFWWVNDLVIKTKNN